MTIKQTYTQNNKHKTILTQSLFIEMPVSKMQRAVMYMCVKGIDFISFYDCSLVFWKFSERVIIFVFFFIL